ncbi:hypothetical protein SLEP1_g39620 [Rubroshorea leprosula]|uniref:Uncharacterized protein n=1 Tax=Rubroshorea leprosula TaxID=152421 RepID=A0AAV5L1G7_9ROSI|nr:hypothetical protein SLEP1_g39620 [Rubroshorea leprosula]
MDTLMIIRWKFSLLLLAAFILADDDSQAMSKLADALNPRPHNRSISVSNAAYCAMVGKECLADNNFSSIPSEFFSGLPTSIQNWSLRVHRNDLTGDLPDSLGRSMVKVLQLHGQRTGLSGTISALSTTVNLVQVTLQNNNFPVLLADLSNCNGLELLNLKNNTLTGIVPESLPTNSGQPCGPQVTTLLEIASAFGYPLKLSDSWRETGNRNKQLLSNCWSCGVKAAQEAANGKKAAQVAANGKKAAQVAAKWKKGELHQSTVAEKCSNLCCKMLMKCW